jgi:ABC-type Fe3+-siderophore transport system permease subunit
MAGIGETPIQKDLFPAEADEAALFGKVRLRMLTSRLWLISAGIGALIFIGAMGFDFILRAHKETPLAFTFSNALVALLASAVVYILLAYGREQRRRVVERMEALNEANHHIRNALQALAFAAGSLKDREEADDINQAITRIRWTLLEVLPKLEPTFEPFEGSAFSAVERLRRPPQSENGVE